MASKIATINWLTATYSMMLTALLVISCTASQKPMPNPVRPIETSIKTTKDVAVGIGTETDSIDKHVVDVRKATPEALIPKIGPSLDGINQDTDDLRVLKTKLEVVGGDLEQAKKDVISLQEIISKQDTTIAKLVAEKESALHKLMVWVILLSIVGVGVSGSLVYTGKMWGISIGFGCLVTLGLAIFITQYSMWFAIGAAAFCVLGLGYVAFELVTRKKISTELVQTIEADKMAMREPARLHLYGNGAVPGHVDVIQSPATKKFVKKLRKKKTVRLAPSAKPVNLGGPDKD